jgi:hypothetical protein
VTAEVIGGLAVWKWLAGVGASVAGFFAVNWVYWVSKRVQSSVTREELADHLTTVVAAIHAESEKSKAETEKLFLQLQVESLREKYNNKVNS